MKKILSLGILLLSLLSVNANASHGNVCLYNKDGTFAQWVYFLWEPDRDLGLPGLFANNSNLGSWLAMPHSVESDCPQTAPSNVTQFYCTGENCAIQLSKTFDFDVQMGGVKADLYVCEVGFNQLCPTCSQHYLTLDGGEDKITTFQTFTQDNAPSKAQVFINDLYFGAEFYVKYCLKAKRLVVGDEPALPYTAVITPSVSIWTGLYNGVGTNDYATISQLGANVYEDCESATGPIGGNASQGTLLTTNGFAPFSDTSTTAITYPSTTLEYCGDTACEKKQCVWTLKFTEQATCYRPMKCVDGVCTPYESTIHTKFDAAVDFDCDSGACAD